MAWLGYLFSLPGALVGAISATYYLRRREDFRALVAGSVAASAVMFGVLINQVAVCSTVMYCLGK
jgi:hypothetical protein